jgi:hypothetical protein
MAVKGNTTRRVGDELVAVTSDYLYLYYFFLTDIIGFCVTTSYPSMDSRSFLLHLPLWDCQTSARMHSGKTVAIEGWGEGEPMCPG